LLDNNTYNLMAQLTEENQSLWRFKNNYIPDASECQECREFWEKMVKDKEDHIAKLARLLKNIFKKIEK
jgi:hypothetical protein